MAYKTPTMHNSPEWKEARKIFQGINATTKGSIEKSKRRHGAKTKALEKAKEKKDWRNSLPSYKMAKYRKPTMSDTIGDIEAHRG